MLRVRALMYLGPACLMIGGAILMLSSLSYDDDEIARYTGAASFLLGVFFAALRFASPACYDGSLVGEALIRACH